MRIAMALLSISLAFGTACKKKEKSGDTTNQGSGAATTGSADQGSAAMATPDAAAPDQGSAAAGSADGAMAGSAATTPEGTPMAKAAGNCPSTVAKSTTTATVKDKAVVVSVTSDDKDAISAIQRRATELVEAKKGGEGGTGATHDGKGTHQGKLGLCPVHVPEGATVEAKNSAKGVDITITPKDGVDALKTEIDGRITKAAEWVKANVKEGEQGTSGGVGGGAGEHGSNHSGEGDSKGKERKGGDGKGGGKGTGGGGGAGTGGGSQQTGSASK